MIQNKKKSRLLFICSKRPFPAHDGGAIRTMQMYRMLNKYYDIDFVFSSRGEKGCYEKPDDYLGIYSCRGFFLPKWKRILQTIRYAFSKLPLQCAYFYNKEMHKFINDHINEYDVVFCNNIRTAIYVEDEAHCKRYIDFVDAISMNYLGASKKEWFPKNILYKEEAKRLLNYEKELTEKFDKTLIISDVDADYIKNHSKSGAKRSFVVPNSVEIPQEIISQSDGYNIVFVGSMFYEPNIVAVTTYAKHVFPLILEKIPDAKFYIVGNRPSEKVKNLACDNIIVTGFVEDPKKYLRISNVVIAPMYSGAGVQNKILEAMSLGCCVVTTEIGAEGLGNIENGKHLIIQSDYNRMANSIIQLLRDKERRIKIGNEAKKYVADNFSFKKVLSIFSKWIESE